jgi:hypothetical protein
VVLATTLGTGHPSSLIVAAITRVYTIVYVAETIGEDEDWLHDLTIDMDFEDGRLTVYGVGEDGTTALTDFGIENLQQIIPTYAPTEELRLQNQRPPNPRFSPDGYVRNSSRSIV